MESQPLIPNPMMKVIPEHPPSETLSNMPPGRPPLSEPFGVCHVFPKPDQETFFGAFPKPAERPFSKTLRAFLRRVPRVPKVKPKDPFEICLMSRSPAESHPESLSRPPPSDSLSES